jgi:DNA-binding response OmpR family regulator
VDAFMVRKRLLIVDDEPRFAAFVERVATGLNYQVEVTHHGREFMKAYDRSPPDLAIIDMVMPDIDGNELILWLVKRHCTANVIIITGFSPDYALNARLLAEFRGLRSVTTLNKPVSVASLREALMAPLSAVDAAGGRPTAGDGPNER